MKMSNNSNLSDQVPYVPISIQSNQIINHKINDFFGDFTVFPSHVLNTNIGFPSNSNNTKFYESGLTIAEEEDGSIVISNNASIDIDSVIEFGPGNLSNLTIVSYNGDININQTVSVNGRIVLMAQQGTITIGSNILSSQNDSIILSGQNIVNQIHSVIEARREVVLSGSVINEGQIQANRIVAAYIGGSGALIGDQIVGLASGFLTITNNTLNGLSNTPNSQGMWECERTIFVVTHQNVSIPNNLELSSHFEIVSAGSVSIPNGLVMNGCKLKIIASQINFNNGDIDVSVDSNNPNFCPPGSITLYALGDISGKNLIADVVFDGSPMGGAFSNQHQPPAQGEDNGTGVTGAIGGEGRPGFSPFSPLNNLTGTPVTVISCSGDINITGIIANLSAQGGKGQDVIGCFGGAGAPGCVTDNGYCTDYVFYHDPQQGSAGGCGGMGGDGGIGGNGADGASFQCIGSSLKLIAGQSILVSDRIDLSINTSAGNGGIVSDCTGGCGGDGARGGWGSNGGAAGNGGNVGTGGTGGNAHGNGKTGNLTILSCGSVSCGVIKLNNINNAGVGGIASGVPGQAGSPGQPGGDCSGHFSGMTEGQSGSIGNNGQSGSDGSVLNNPATAVSVIIARHGVQISNFSKNKSYIGMGSDFQGPLNSIPIALISYGSISIPDIVTPNLSNATFFESMIGMCGSGIVSLNGSLTQLSLLPFVVSGDVTPINFSSSDILSFGLLEIISLSSDLSFNDMPNNISFYDPIDYQFFLSLDPVYKNITAIIQNVHVEEIQISVPALKYVYPGKLQTYSFGINQKNTSGTLVATLTFSDQVFEQTITVKEKTRIFYGNGNSGASGVYVAEYDAGTSDLKNIQFFNLPHSGVKSVCFDAIHGYLYFVSSSNELGYADVNDVGVVSSPSILSVSSFSDSFGLFWDGSNNKIYWVNNVLDSSGSIVYGMICVADMNNADSIPVLCNPLVLDQSVSSHSSFFLDVNTRNAYWTNDHDNSLWIGVVDNLGNPTQIYSQRYLYSFSSQICGLCLDSTQGTIYWLTQANGGELWSGFLDNVANPSAILNPTLLYSGNFGTSDNPTSTPSGFCFSFLSQNWSFNNIQTPVISGTYPVSIAVYDSDLPECSDAVQTFVSVPDIVISDVQFPTSVLAGSNFEISFVVNIQDPLNSDPSGSFLISGGSDNNQPVDFQGSWQTLSDVFQAPSVNNVQEQNFSIQIIHSDSRYQIQSDFSITFLPLTVQAQASPQSVISGETINLSVADVFPGVTYIWTSAGNNFSDVISDAVYNVLPPSGQTTIYTVKAQNGLVRVQSSVSVCASSVTVINPNIPKKVIAGSNFSVSFDVDIQGEGQVSDAFITFNNNTYYLGASDTYQYTLVAPCTPSDYNLRIQVYDSVGASATYLDNSIKVKAFSVKVSASLSDITPGQSVDLSASTKPALSDVSYIWTSNTNQIIQNSDAANASSSPSITTSYTVVATNGLCSFSDTVTVNVVPYIVLSDVSYMPQTPVVEGSPITVSFTPTIFSGDVNSTTVVATLSMGNNCSQFYVSDGVQANLNFNINCTSGPLTIFAYDFSDRSCSTSDVISLINVIPLTVTATASPQLLYRGQICTLSVSDPVSDASYAWYQGVTYISSDATTIRENIGNPFETYTIIAKNGSCYASDFVTVGVATIEILSTKIPEQMPAGSLSDVFFQIEAFNGTGAINTVVTFNNQTVFSSDIDYTWQMFFANGSNAAPTAGVYMSQFIPLLNGPINTTFLTMSTFVNNAINSVYFDAVNQNLYCVYADNQLWVISAPQTPTSSSYAITVSDLDNPYGLFVDSTNGYIYWVNADSDTINVAQISNLNDPANITVGSSSVLLSGVGLNEPSGFFLDTTTQNVYWTNLSDNSLRCGYLDNLSDPTTITYTCSLTGGSLNQPTGVVVNPQDGTIYWMNSVNGGELWQAELWPNLTNPKKLNNARLLSSGNFGTASDSNTLPSGLCIIFPEMTYSCSIVAPSVGGNYPLTITISDSDLSSNSCTSTINVSNIVLSDLSVPSTVLAGSAIDVMFAPIIISGNSDNNAFITISLSDSSVSASFTVSDGQVGTFPICAPCVSSDTVKTLTIMVRNLNNPDCYITNDVQITIQSLNPQILAFMSDFVTPVPSDMILSGQEIILSVNNPFSDVLYSWSVASSDIASSDMGSNATTISDTPQQTTTYTVFAANGGCCSSDSITINVNTPQSCVFLSDVVFSITGESGASQYKLLTVSGYQFSLISDAVRNLQLSVNSIIRDTLQTDVDGAFVLSDIYFDLKETITLEAFISGNPLCIPTVFTSDFSFSRESLAFTINWVGSAFTPVFYLPPDLAERIDPNVSDMGELFSIMCAYAKNQQCNRFVVGLEILENSDFLPSDSPVLNGLHLVFVFCSDNNFYAEEIFQGFNFIVSNFASDAVVVNHTDSIYGSTSRPMKRKGFSVAVAKDKLKWWSPENASQAKVNVKSPGNLFDEPLLVVNGKKNSIADIGEIICLPICNKITSDARYVCKLFNNAQQMVGYLDAFYPDYSDLIVSDKNQVTYTGEIAADSVFIDLDCGTINFSNFCIPCCSDPICF